MTDEDIESTREKYIGVLKPLFLPDDPISNDIVNYFASLLRIVGMEDGGWDPYLESRVTLEDMNSLMQIDLPSDRFPEKDLTIWRIGLLMYAHIVEMDAPYEVLTNLLRFRLRKGYSPNPFFMFLNKEQRKRFKRRGLYPGEKINIIKRLSQEANISVGDIFDEFYDAKLRNAISHSDFILTDTEFRSRSGVSGTKALKIPLEKLNEKITKAKVFAGTVFGLDEAARRIWGERKHTAIPYDPHYKGLMEILVAEDDIMCGFKIHWPNNSESVYRRTREGIEMSNCMLDIKNSTVAMFVDRYARRPGKFSPLVEENGVARYTPLEGAGDSPHWPEERG